MAGRQNSIRQGPSRSKQMSASAPHNHYVSFETMTSGAVTPYTLNTVSTTTTNNAQPTRSGSQVRLDTAAAHGEIGSAVMARYAAKNDTHKGRHSLLSLGARNRQA